MRHVDDLQGLGRRIAEMRRARGLSQRDLSFEGCSYAYISRVEAGARQPSIQVLEHLATRLGTSVRYLTTGEHHPIEEGLLEAGLDPYTMTDEERDQLNAAIEKSLARAARGLGVALLTQRRRLEIRDLEQTLEERRRELAVA